MVNKFFLFLILLPVFSLFAQEIKVTASTDTTDYLIGDQIKYHLVINTNKNVYIINPFFRDTLKNVDVIKISDPVVSETETGKTIKYETLLTRFDSSQVTIPPIKIEYRVQGDTTLKSVLSNSVTFNVHTMKVSMKEEIKDIKPPVRLFNYLFLIYIGIALLILVIGYFVYRKYFKNKPQPVIEPKKEKIFSHQLALRKLDQLDHEELWQKGFVKEYHTRITDIIREYFEKQFELPALELTTTDSLKQLSKHPQGVKVLDITSQFLNNADLVKFAKFTPLELVNKEMMVQAKEIVTKTISVQKEVEVTEVANVS
jgi:hypothetical protein